MKERNDLIANFAIMLFISILICGFQTSFLVYLIPIGSGPQLWLIAPTYWATNRSFQRALTFVYLNTLFIHPFTNMPFGYLLAIQLIIISAVSFVRSRIYWPTLSYFILTLIATNLLASSSLLILSLLTEKLPATDLNWMELFWSLLFIPLFGSGIFYLFRRVDTLFPVSSVGAEKT